MNAYWNRGRVGKLVGAGLLAILLGAVGSGVWERLLSPALHSVTNASFRVLGSVSSSFKDSIYAEAAKGFHEGPSLALLGIGLILTMGFLVGSVVNTFRNVFDARFEAESAAAVSDGKDAEVETKYNLKIAHLTRSLRRLAFGLAFAVFVFVVAASFLVVRASYINSITTYALNSIEILAPACSEEERLSLRSEFLRVREARDFYRFNEHLLSISKKSGLPLPTFSPL